MDTAFIFFYQRAPWFHRLNEANTLLKGGAIAQWIRLRPPSCHPGFESRAHIYNFIVYSVCASVCHVKRTKMNKKTLGLAHLKNTLSRLTYLVWSQTVLDSCSRFKIVLKQQKMVTNKKIMFDHRSLAW